MLARQFAYDAWANRESLRSLQRLASPPEQALRRLAHVAAAQQLWWERVQGVPQSLPVWPTLSLDETARLLDETAERWRALVEGMGQGDLARPVGYTNSKGDRFESALGDILQHVVLHGAYHRGQVAGDVRAAGGEPAYTDFIHAARQGVLVGG